MAIKLIDDIKKYQPEYSNLSDKQVVEVFHQKEASDVPVEQVEKYLNQNITRSTAKVAGVGFAENIESGIPGVNLAMKHIAEGVNTSIVTKVAYDQLAGFGVPKMLGAMFTGEYKPGISEEQIDTYTERSHGYEYKFQLTDKEREMLSGKIGSVFGSAVKFIAYSPAGLTPFAMDIYGNTYLDIDKTHPEWNELQKRSFALAHAIPEALLERWGTNLLLDPITNIGKGTLKQGLKNGVLFNGVKRGLQGYITEGAQEASQEIASNIVDKLYGMDRGLFDGMVESFVLGGLVGGTMGFGTGTIGQGISKQKYRSQLKDIYGFNDAEVTELEKIMTGVVDENIKNNPEGVNEALRMIQDSSVLNELPDITMELRDKLKDMNMSSEDIIDFITGTTIDDQKAVLDDIVSRETDEQVQIYEKGKQKLYQEIIDMGIDEREAKAEINIMDEFVDSMAQREQVAREDVLRRVGLKFKQEMRKKAEAEKVGQPMYQDATGKNKPEFYSKLSKSLESAQDKMSVDQFKGWIKKQGIKQEELDWLDIDTYLQGKKSITKQEMQDYIRANMLEVEETTLGTRKREINYDSPYATPRVVELIKERVAEEEDVESTTAEFDIGRMGIIIQNDAQAYRELVDAGLDPDENWGSAINDVYKSTGEPAKFGGTNTTLPGGENYREVLFKLPERETVPEREQVYKKAEQLTGMKRGKISSSELEKAGASQEFISEFYSVATDSARDRTKKDIYTSSHFDEPNILAHTRIDDRVDADGNKVLFVEEVQSDWHQAGRDKGYKVDKKWAKSDLQVIERNGVWGIYVPVIDVSYSFGTKENAEKNVDGVLKDLNKGKIEGRQVPDAPLKKTWHEFVMKKVLQMATEQGYDKVAWTTGEMQNDRYDLSKQVDYISAQKHNLIDDGYYVNISTPETMINLVVENGKVIRQSGNTGAEIFMDKSLNEVIGKDLADKILSQKEDNVKYEGQDLRVGGKGMKDFYNKMIPNFLNKYLKKYNSKVGVSEIDVLGKGEDYSLRQTTDGRWTFFTKENSDLVMSFDTREDADAWYDKNRPTSIEKVLSVEITPEMVEEFTTKGQPLFQGNNSKRGMFVRENGQSIITLFTGEADRSTIVHEFGHVFLTYYQEYHPELLKEVNKWVGVDDINNLSDKDYRAYQEKFAKGFEAYLMRGESPNSKLKQVFEDFKQWLTDIYGGVNNLDVKLNKEMISFYDDMLAGREIMPKAELSAKQRVMALFQDEWTKLDDLKKKAKKLKKEYRKKAYKAEIDSIMQEIDDIYLILHKKPAKGRLADIKKRAMEDWYNNPLSMFFEDKIKISPEYEAELKRMGVPAIAKTTRENASTFDELMETAMEQTGLDETQVMEQLAKMQSKKKHIADYIEKEINFTKEIKGEEYGADDVETLESIMEVKLAEMKERIKDDVKNNSLTNIHKEAITYLKNLDIPANDKVKLLSKITQAKTRYSLRKVINEMEQRGLGYKEADVKRKIKAEISKQLKYTKPVKSGSKTKGRYDYLSNQFFERLRSYDKMTMRQAEDAYAKFEEKVNDATYMPDQMDVLEMKFLSMKIMGLRNGSLEMMNQVLTGILDAKQVGRDVSEWDKFVQKMKTNNDIDKAKEILENSKGNAESVQTKAMNAYRRGASNVWSLYNSMFGKKFADEYDFELQENRKNDASLLKTKRVAEETARLFGLKSPRKLNSKFTELGAKDYILVDKTADAVTYELNKLELMDIYNSMKNENIRNRYEFSFGETEIDSILQNLTQEEMDVADMWQEVAQEYYEENNKRHIEIYHKDLGQVENYWMASSEFVQNIFDDIKMQGETPGSWKPRAGMRIPKPKDAWQKLSKHIAESEHIIHMSRKHEQLSRLFNNRKVKELITKKFGEPVYNLVLKQINEMSLNKTIERNDAVTDVLGHVINNWVTAKIAFNPNVFLKQLNSVVNYMEVMPVGEWHKYFIKGVTNPKKTLDFMWEVAPFLEARFERGYSEAVQRAIRESGKIGKYSNNWSKALSALVRTGDIGAIVYGGFPYLQYQLDNGVPMQEALDNYERVTLKAQQSGNRAGLSDLQNNRSAIYRLFLAFKNTPQQYLRKIVDTNVSYFNGDIDAKQYAKTMTIYAVIQPLLYAFVGDMAKGFFFGDEPDEVMDNMMMSLALSPLNAIPVIDDMASFGLRTMMDKPTYKMFQTPVLDDLETAWKNFTKNEITVYDVLESFATFTELGTALPADTYLRLLDSNLKRYNQGKMFVE